VSIATDAHLLLRVPKTGTTEAAARMRASHGACEPYRASHAPLSWLREHHPQLVEGKLVFTLVREPWSWYGSFFLHLCRIGIEQDGGFEAWLERVTSAAEHRPFSEPPNTGIHWRSIGDGSRGLCTGCHDWITEGHAMAFIATDRLHEGLTALLGEAETMPDPIDRNERAHNGPASFGGRSYAEVYDQRMIGLVARADAGLIERFGFEPFRPSPQALYHG